MLTPSSDSPWLWLAPLLVSLGLGLAGSPVARRLAIKLDVLDQPLGLKIHRLPTPLLGGLAVYAAFALGALVFLPFSGAVLGIVAGGAVAVTVGVIDDKICLPPLVHLGGQTLAAIVAVVAGLGIVQNVSNPWASSASNASWHVPALLGIIFTIFWIVGMMNTVNFLDGLDGLSTGVGVIAAGLLAIWVAQPRHFIAHPGIPLHRADLILPVVLAGALLGFLPYNWHPARIFIGDSGTLFMGLALAALSIVGPAKIGTALLVLIIPVLDVAWAVVRRQLRGRSFLAGDKQHVYHRMLELGISHPTTVVALYVICIALGALDLALERLQKLIAFGVLGAITAVAFIALEVAGSRREAASRAGVVSRPAEEA